MQAPLVSAREVSFDSGDVAPLHLSKGRYETPVTSGNAFARSALASVLPIPEGDFRISADGYLVTLVPLLGEVVSLEEPLGAYTQHPGSAWTASGGDAGERFRRWVEHDGHRYQALARKAAELGLAPAPDPGLRDHPRVPDRLALHGSGASPLPVRLETEDRRDGGLGVPQRAPPAPATSGPRRVVPRRRPPPGGGRTPHGRVEAHRRLTASGRGPGPQGAPQGDPLGSG